MSEMMMPFDSNLIQWPSISAFDAYLQTVPRPAYVTGIVVHNTYKPDETTWKGMASMKSMQAFYIEKGWSSGPHLYLAATAPNRAHTGIFQMTPITRPGTHAGPCNAHNLGIEVCGDFEARPPNADQYSLLIAVLILILHKWGLPPDSVSTHRDCMQGRTCPGKFLTGTQIRADLRKPAPSIPPVRPYRVKGLPVYQRSERSGALWGHLASGEQVVIDDPFDGHLSDGRGFVDLAGLEPL
jgi:hypothetical protein